MDTNFCECIIQHIQRFIIYYEFSFNWPASGANNDVPEHANSGSFQTTLQYFSFYLIWATDDYISGLF